jgi:hypothetical protein
MGGGRATAAAGTAPEALEALTIGEVAKRSGVATSALRFYEEQGLIHSERTDSGHRRYPRAVIRRIAFVVFARSASGCRWRRSGGTREAAAQSRARAA